MCPCRTPPIFPLALVFLLWSWISTTTSRLTRSYFSQGMSQYSLSMHVISQPWYISSTWHPISSTSHSVHAHRQWYQIPLGVSNSTSSRNIARVPTIFLHLILDVHTHLNGFDPVKLGHALLLQHCPCTSTIDRFFFLAIPFYSGIYLQPSSCRIPICCK